MVVRCRFDDDEAKLAIGNRLLCPWRTRLEPGRISTLVVVFDNTPSRRIILCEVIKLAQNERKTFVQMR